MNYKTIDEAIQDIFLDSEDDFEAYRKIRGSLKFLNRNFDRAELDKTFAELYLLYEQSESDMLRCFLLNKYQSYYQFDKAEEFAKEFQENGILVLKESHDIMGGVIKVIHPNPKIKTHDKYPIQVSRWRLGEGAMSDCLYKDPLSAVKQEYMISYLRISQDELSEIESILIENESDFRRESAASSEMSL